MQDKKKVLIIDDEADLCLLLKDFFERRNCEVSISHSLQHGLGALSSFSPEVVFLDNNLPDGLGWERAADIASQYPSVYIILISAFHPSLPQMPQGAHFHAMEKPLSRGDLSKQFDLF